METTHKNAFLYYSCKRREELATVHPSWSVEQVSAELGRQCKTLTTAERKQCVNHARSYKARFHTEAHKKRSQQQNDVQNSILRKRQPNEPRQPDTAYICFWKSRRSEVVAANPLLAAPLVSKEVGRQWRALPDGERQIWEDMAAKDKRRFHEEIALIQPSLAATLEISPMPKNSPKDPFAPRPAKTGFQVFMSQNRESFTLLNMTINEFRAEMSQLWKRLGDADRNEWYKLAKQDEERYETEMNNYEPPAYTKMAAECAHRRIDELKRLARGDVFAPRLPMNAYNTYLAIERQEMVTRRPKLKNPEIMREIGIAWKSLSDDERVQFQHKAEEDVERFRKEMDAYLLQQDYHRTTSAHRTKRPTRKEQDLQVCVVLREEAKQPGVGRKKRKSATPRRPKTAYNLMYMSKRTELLATYQVSHNECSALCGRLWRQMSETEREPYKHMAAEDKRRYEAELKIYNAQVSKLNEKMLHDSTRLC